MGQMASKDYSNKSFTWESIKAAVPGPGAYSAPSSFDKTWQPGMTNKCLFAGRNGKSFYSADLTPGPGDYEPKVLSSTAASDCGAAFNSRAIRLTDKKAKCPAPGAYEVGREPFSKHSYGSTCPSAAFKSGVERGKVAEVLAKKNANQPGPSSYERNQAHMLGLHGAGSHMFTGKIARAPLSFADEEVIHARKQEKFHGTPGPGSYFDPDNPESKNPKKKKFPTSTGAFKSSSARISYMDVKNTPGPSQYNASSTGKPLKKSFHLNTTGSWV
eukprot:TRINITY_DN7831_c0_g1_i7.p1 TRINITY_DN7831_c0_g1~~TRINITY_DN7831_c0_g1_i7.p1  ORF type:complete len:272 (+),score=25.18 TRINITY_DN7831_c0_g1_i7:364-1179(+)